ncbi:hypothetical protein TGGT1_208340 [Toxoplasma gondii GT1]|uniref:PH domain-containing protein n=3 Tax=Toxoplasma gondii TaxID=5811 RepID=S7VSI6_TOXGG|nr:hypothetical protein TGGT1_208340 [Toxoplasma gondii GT1]KAF4645976.1 hypothetical protein TGRH88_022520 [Toxoplasma gondii]
MVGQATQPGARKQSVFLHAETGTRSIENDACPPMITKGEEVAMEDSQVSTSARQAPNAPSVSQAVSMASGNRKNEVELLRTAILKSRATVASRWRGSACVPGSVTGAVKNSAEFPAQPFSGETVAGGSSARQRGNADAQVDSEKLETLRARKSQIVDSGKHDTPSRNSVRTSGGFAQEGEMPAAPAGNPEKGGWLAKGRALKAQMAAAKTTPQQPLVLKVAKRKANPPKANKAMLKRVAFPNQSKEGPRRVDAEREAPDPDVLSLRRLDTWRLLTKDLSAARTPSFLRSSSSDVIDNAEDLNLTGSNIFPFFSGSVSTSDASVALSERLRTVRDSDAGSAYMYQSLPAGGELSPSLSVSPFSSTAGPSRTSASSTNSRLKRQDVQTAEEIESGEPEAMEVKEEVAPEPAGESGEVPFANVAGYSGNLRLPSVLEESQEYSTSARLGSRGEERPDSPAPRPRSGAPKKQPKKKKLEPLPADGSVEPFVEERAAEEDFDRETMLDDFDIPSTATGLSPAVERLRQERVALARWVRRLRGTGTAMQQKHMRVEKYLKPHQDLPGLDIKLAANYPPAAFEPPLTEAVEARGDRMEEILMKDAQMPSAKVWQLEQTNRQRLKHLAQQRKHISILQRALRKSQRETRAAERKLRGDDETSSSSESSAPSPREAERLILQEQCESLMDRVKAETAHRESYQRAWFLEQRQKERVAEKYNVLQRRLKAAQTVTRMEQAKQEEKQENIDDLKARLGERIEVLRRVTGTSEQYEYELVRLQRRYEALASYLKESQEKASSFEEGLREARSSLEHETALLQIEKNKSLNLGERLRERENAMERMKIELRLEQDRVLSREQTIQELRDSLNENAQLLLQAKDELVAEHERAEEERRRHEQTLIQAKTLQSNLLEAQQTIDTLMSEKAFADQQEAALKHLHENFLLLLESSQKQSDVLEETVEAMAKKKHKATQLLQRAVEEIQSGIHRKSVEEERLKADLAAAKARLSGAVEELEAERATQVETMNRAQDKYMEDHASYQKTCEAMRGEIEEQKARLEALTADLQEAKRRRDELEKWGEKMKEKNEALERRVVSSFSAQGRSGRGSMVRLVKRLQQGATMERANVGKKKVGKNFIKLTKDMQIVWTMETKDKLAGFYKQKAIRLQHIVGIDYGTASAACRSRMAAASKRKEEILPWRCFEIRTLSTSYLFTAQSDDIAATWVVCLGRLVSQWSDAPNIKTHREVCVRRVKMKLQRYCQEKRITPRKMWLDAIARASGQPVSDQPRRARRAVAEKKGK